MVELIVIFPLRFETSDLDKLVEIVKNIISYSYVFDYFLSVFLEVGYLHSY
jgi:hypothetical protein